MTDIMFKKYDKVVVNEDNVLGVKAESIAVHFSRQEIAAILTALECADSGIIEQYLEKELGWPIEKRTTYINGHNATKPGLIERLQWVVALEG